MNDEIASVIQRYRHSGILVDTNLLLLYFIGSFDIDLIPRFKRTDHFSQDDFAALSIVIGEFKRIITTPNILTEVYNLSNQLSGKLRTHYLQTFAVQMTIVDGFHEIHTASATIVGVPGFVRFGLTDIGILLTAKNKYLVLTDDLPFYIYLLSFSVETINFNYLRRYLDN